MHLPVRLLVNVTVTAGAAAALVFSGRHLLREDSLKGLRRDVRDAALVLASAGAATEPLPVATILVIGFRGHGKSALINTTCRALTGEAGPLLLRAEVAPQGAVASGTTARRSIPATVTEEAFLSLVDTPPLPDPVKMTRADVEAAINSGSAAGEGLPAAECVVLVIRCGGPAKDRSLAVRKLPEITAPIRDRGLSLVVVLTHKRSLRTARQAEELRQEVAFRARTDCVYFIENYTADGTQAIRHPPVIRNDFDTHFTALMVVRQCLEFIKLHRSFLEQRKGLPTNTVPPRSASASDHL